MSRLRAVVVVALGVHMGCGGDDPAPPLDDTEVQGADEESDAADEPIDPEWGLDFAITGRSTPMTARAEVKIVEGELPVHVAITGRTSGTDFVMIDLTFDGLDGAMGPHHVQFGLPELGEHVANSSLDDTWYYSQGGEIDVSVGPDGSIEGSFAIDLARGTLAAPGEPVVFARSDVTTKLEGTFSGDWVLNCHSRLMGHMTLIFGGDYCDDLVLAEQ